MSADDPANPLSFALTTRYLDAPGLAVRTCNAEVPSIRGMVVPTGSQPVPSQRCSVSSSPTGWGVTLPVIPRFAPTRTHGAAETAIFTFPPVPAPDAPVATANAAINATVSRRIRTRQSYCVFTHGLRRLTES